MPSSVHAYHRSLCVSFILLEVPSFVLKSRLSRFSRKVTTVKETALNTHSNNETIPELGKCVMDGERFPRHSQKSLRASNQTLCLR